MHSWIKEIGAAAQALKCHPRVSHFLFTAYSQFQEMQPPQASVVYLVMWASGPDGHLKTQVFDLFFCFCSFGNTFFLLVVGGGEAGFSDVPGRL